MSVAPTARSIWVVGPIPNTAYSLSKILTSRSNVSESKWGTTSIHRPFVKTIFKAQVDRLFPLDSRPASFTPQTGLHRTTFHSKKSWGT
jgi:hypothetical protein